MIFLNLGLQPFANEYLKKINKVKEDINYWWITIKIIILFQLKKNF